jgi:hypothetical protein
MDKQTFTYIIILKNLVIHFTSDLEIDILAEKKGEAMSKEYVRTNGWSAQMEDLLLVALGG